MLSRQEIEAVVRAARRNAMHFRKRLLRDGDDVDNDFTGMLWALEVLGVPDRRVVGAWRRLGCRRSRPVYGPRQRPGWQNSSIRSWCYGFGRTAPFPPVEPRLRFIANYDLFFKEK